MAEVRSEDEKRARLRAMKGEKGYTYEEYPRMLYRAGEQPTDPREELIVHNDDQCEEALADGWSKQPPLPETAKRSTVKAVPAPAPPAVAEVPQAAPARRKRRSA